MMRIRMMRQNNKPIRSFRIGKIEMRSLRGAGWMVLFTARFWRALICNRLWFGAVPVAAVSLVAMFLLYRFAADFSVRAALEKAFVYCLWSALCYGIGVWSVVCRRLGVSEPDEEDSEDQGENGSAGTWIGHLIFGVLALLFLVWLLRPALVYWIWDEGDWIRAVIGTVFKVLLVVGFLCPIIWSSDRK